MNQSRAASLSQSPKPKFDKRRGIDVLFYDGFLFVSTGSQKNQDGSKMWKCEHARDQYKCKATCSTIGDTMKRCPKVPHTCPHLTPIELIYKQAERDIVNQVKVMPNTRPKNIFMDHINKATQRINLPNGYTAESAQQLPQWEKFQQKAYRAKRSEMPKAPKSREDVKLEGEYFFLQRN